MKPVVRNLIALLSGVLFSVGLALSGMTQPSKVVGFLTLADPSLMFVMVGAIAVYALAHRYRLRRAEPFFAPRFPSYELTRVDVRLVAGAAIFGVGWGLAGYCPGPGVAALGAGGTQALIFIPAMLVGMFLVKTVERLRELRVVSQRSVSS